jgi:hypothetical protein
MGIIVPGQDGTGFVVLRKVLLDAASSTPCQASLLPSIVQVLYSIKLCHVDLEGRNPVNYNSLRNRHGSMMRHR